MKKLLLLLTILLLVLAIVAPAYADSEWAQHDDHCPGTGDGRTEHPIPPGWAEAAPPGPLGETWGH